MEQKRNRTTLSQGMRLDGRGYRLPTGAACARVTKAPPVLMPRCRCRVAVGSAARAPSGTPARVRADRGKCHGTATCVRDPRPGEPPHGRPRSSSAPGCGPTSEPVHDTLAGRTSKSVKKFLLRDHALPQSQAASALGAKKGCADGARVRPRHALIWRPHPGAAWPAASPPANAAPTAGIRDPGSNADSNAAVGTCVHSLCAGRRASAVVGNDRLAYHDDGPRECVLPRDSPG